GVAYDDTGHLTQSPVGSYEYDQVGMMSGTSEGRTYIYTASGERILIVPSSGGGLWRWTLRDLAGRKVREYESEREDFFLWLEDDYHDGQRLIASQRETAEGGRRHYHPDHLGTPRLITNAGGQRISTHDYYPFGVEITSIHQEAARGYGREQTAQFTGHERDDMDSSLTEHSVYLDYMHARFYNPNWGRFLTVDPLMAPQRNMTTPQRWNRYAYTVNNPVKYVDPDGRKDTIYIVSMFSREHTPIFRAALNKAIAGTRFEGRVEVYGPQATRGQMHAAVALGDRTDIVAALLHSGRKPADQGGTMMGETAAGRVDSANPFTGNQLASWAARDGDAPTVILGGCSSDGCAAALAKATGSTAFGTTARTWNSEAMNAMVAMIGVLAHGGTDTEAADAGSAQLVNLPPCELARPRCNEDRKDPADIIAKDPD
ncbi:MAG TPA: RHS repeat-associated core domain-containing protein, partial [Thermoanaerobaculia bacterium]|nr:RHS repeat-associated core domain-containing protein [Thermoanaerobaculia bacterium]